MRSTLASAIALMLTLNVPATLGLVVLADADRPAAVRARQLHAGRYAVTAAAVQLYALGLVGYSVVKIVSPTFYAHGPQPHAGRGGRRGGAAERGAERDDGAAVRLHAGWR